MFSRLPKTTVHKSCSNFSPVNTEHKILSSSSPNCPKRDRQQSHLASPLQSSQSNPYHDQLKSFHRTRFFNLSPQRQTLNGHNTVEQYPQPRIHPKPKKKVSITHHLDTHQLPNRISKLLQNPLKERSAHWSPIALPFPNEPTRRPLSMVNNERTRPESFQGTRENENSQSSICVCLQDRVRKLTKTTTEETQGQRLTRKERTVSCKSNVNGGIVSDWVSEFDSEGNVCWCNNNADWRRRQIGCQYIIQRRRQ